MCHLVMRGSRVPFTLRKGRCPTMKKTMHKLPISLVLALLSVFTVFSVALAYFPDIQGHWAEKIIQKWQDKGFAKGYPDGQFKPDQTVTRAEFTAFTNRYFALKNTGDGKAPYADVQVRNTTTGWFFDDVLIAKTYGYNNYYTDTVSGKQYFLPNNNITRQDVALFIFNVLHMNANDPKYCNALANVKDANQISDYAKNAVKSIIGEGFMVGYPDGTFHPQGYLTRAEAITILDKICTLYPDTYHAGDKGTDVQLVVTAGQVVTVVQADAKPNQTQVFVAGKAGGASYMVNTSAGIGEAKTDIFSFVNKYCPNVVIPQPPALPGTCK